MFARSAIRIRGACAAAFVAGRRDAFALRATRIRGAFAAGCRAAGFAAVLVLAIGGAAAPADGAGRPQPPDPPPADGRGQLPQGQIPDLGRPTEAGDEVPTFDYDAYFPGVWTFEWRVPDSPLGPGGLITGTETFEPGDGRNYRAVVEAEGPDGPFTVRSTVIHLAGQRAFVRQDADSRGFAMLRAGRIGGDLGGFYTIHYETAPFEAGGRQVRLRMTTRLVSPVNYRVESRISVDGGPFTNFGNAWWRKSVPGVPPPE